MLRHLVAEDEDALHHHLTAQPSSLAVAHWLRDQQLAPYAHYRLKQARALARLQPEVAAFFNEAAQRTAMREAVIASASHAALAALAAAQVEVIALKGWALANTVYPAPRCRPMGDLDLWVRREQCEAAVVALEGIGYSQGEKDDRPTFMSSSIGGEWQMVGPPPTALLVEIQWPALRGEWVRRATRVPHDEIWQRSTPTTIEGLPTRLLATEDALILLAVHQGINHHFTFPCWLRTQMDIHHLTLDPALDWRQLVTSARRWGVATVTWQSLVLAATLLDTPIPDDVLDNLAPSAARQRGLSRFDLAQSVVEMRPTSYSRRRLLLQLALSDSAAAMARVVYRAFVPESEWLMLRYDLADRRALPRARLRHLQSLLLKGRI